MNKHLILLATLLSGLTGNSAQAQHPATTADELYNEGTQLYLHGHYIVAEQTLEKFLALPASDLTHRTLIVEAEYMTVCTAYHLKDADRLKRINAYLDTYPDTPHANRLHSMAANVLYTEGNYTEALTQYQLCDLELLGDKERDEASLYKAICLLKTGDMQEAYTLLTVVQTISTEYESDARYYKAYIDYTHHRLTDALSAFETLQTHPIYGPQATCYIADILLQTKSYNEALHIADRWFTKIP